jgi:chromosome segregation ATPase
MNLFSKAKLIVKATSHDILDRVIDANSVPAHEQLIRDLEAAMQAESTETIKAQVEAQTLHVKIAAIQQQIDDYNAGIVTQMKAGGHDHEVEEMMNHVVEFEAERDEVKASEDAANENYKLLSETLGKLRDKHTQMMKELRALRTAVSQAKTDQGALETMRKVNDLTQGVDSMHLGGALAAAQQKSAVARAELRNEVGNIQDSPEAALQKAKVAARLADMRAKLAT